MQIEGELPQAASNPTIDEIADNFSLLDEWDDRYRYIIELGRALRPLPASDRSEEATVIVGIGIVLGVDVLLDPDEARLTEAGDGDAGGAFSIVMVHLLHSSIGTMAMVMMAMVVRVRMIMMVRMVMIGAVCVTVGTVMVVMPVAM